MKEVPDVAVATRDEGQSFRVGEWDVDPALLEISREGEVRHLEPRVMELLVCMATRAGETISREELLDSVWGDRIVVEAVLTQAISQLRGGFDDDRKSPRYVQTVHRRGYRLVAPVRWLDRPDAAITNAPSPSRIGAARRGRLRPWIGVALVLLSLLTFIGVRQRLADQAPTTYPSIAVLPFENLSSESEEYLAIGLTEMLITDLAKIPGLKVISFTSALRYRSLPTGGSDGCARIQRHHPRRSPGRARVVLRRSSSHFPACDAPAQWECLPASGTRRLARDEPIVEGPCRRLPSIDRSPLDDARPHSDADPIPPT